MATLTRGKTFISGETVEPADMHQLVDSATISGIVNADIDASAAIAGSKLASGAVTDTQLAIGAVTGAPGGGKLAASAITGQTPIDAIAAADAFLVHDDSNTALRKVTWSQLQPAGSVVNTDYVEAVGVQTFANNYLATNTSAPTITSGNEVLSKSFATSNNTNYVILQGSLHVGSTASEIVVMLFAGSTLIATRSNYVATYIAPINFIIKHAPASNASVTYSVRISSPSGTYYLNRGFTYDIYPTSVRKSSLLIQEIKA